MLTSDEFDSLGSGPRYKVYAGLLLDKDRLLNGRGNDRLAKERDIDRIVVKGRQASQ
jgi:hypothetical protein